jgi:oligopeptide transport system substrate-binding protein
VPLTARKLFPYVVGFCALGALAYAVTFGQLEQADFTFNNGTEVKTIDPAKAEGQPERRILDALFEGLLRTMPDGPPDEHGLVPMEPKPGVAESYTVSDDGRVYTFKIREDANWSDGTPITAHDFVWSWRRTLHPDTGSQYTYHLYYIVGAEKYNLIKVDVGDRVEVELYDRPGVKMEARGGAVPSLENQLQPFPRGTILRGILREIVKPPEPAIPDSYDEDAKGRLEAEWKAKWVYRVDVKPTGNGEVDWDAEGEMQAFAREPTSGEVSIDGEIIPCHYVLYDYETGVGVRAQDDYTLVVTLNNSTPYFNELVAFYPMYPVNRECVETYGWPLWTKPDNIVSNGPFTMQDRRIRDRIRMVKNPHYWDAENVQLETVDALTVTSETTDLNMFLNGQTDWGTTVPTPVIPQLRALNEKMKAKGQPEVFVTAPALIVYFYRINVTRPPFNDTTIVEWEEDGEVHRQERGIMVRHALNMATDKQQIVDKVTKAGQQPARHVVPPGFDGYESPQCGPFDPQAARKLLERAGFPGGRGMPRVQILFNDNQAHRAIAEVIQQDWKVNLGVNAELRQLEWGVYLQSTTQLDYSVARAGWIADYPDPNTFLDMWVTNGPQNNTGWSNAQFDQLIKDAEEEREPQARYDILEQAEGVLMEGLPIIPIYFYVSLNTISPRVEGFFPNLRDEHPLHILRVKSDERWSYEE